MHVLSTGSLVHTRAKENLRLVTVSIIVTIVTIKKSDYARYTNMGKNIKNKNKKTKMVSGLRLAHDADGP